jgi:DNA-binding transcriptional ArsR family regulator
MDHLGATFAALADPTRRAIVARLAKGPTHVGELGQPFHVSAPAISRHLRVLEEAGLVERRIDAQRRICRLRGDGLQAAYHWIEQYRRFWDDSLDRLVELLEQPPMPPIGGPRPIAAKRPGPAAKRRRTRR